MRCIENINLEKEVFKSLFRQIIVSLNFGKNWKEFWKELLNQLKNLSITTSRRKEIIRKNVLNFTLIKFPVSQYYVKAPENICRLINNFTATSVFVFAYSILLWINFFLKSVTKGKRNVLRCLLSFQAYRSIYFRFPFTQQTMINNNFPFLLKYVLLVSSLPEEKT